MRPNKSVVGHANQVQLAVRLIELGARMAVLEAETDISHERLCRLHKEITGKSPSKGQLPYSLDWFIEWSGNIHSSLFVNLHEYLNKVADIDPTEAFIKAYELYLEEITTTELEPVLSITRAHRLTKFIDNGMLSTTACSLCKGQFVTYPHEIAKHYVCGLCKPPSRAGKRAPVKVKVQDVAVDGTALRELRSDNVAVKA